MSATALAPGPGSKNLRWPALIPPVLIAIPVVLKLAGIPVGSGWIIFTLLFGLMLTGMPISISLGLTVLTYLFTMTTVPIQSVALKLFTGIERFEIMAIPFFILAGNFLTHGGVARRMINFASAMVGHWHGGLGLAGVMACALFAARVYEEGKHLLLFESIVDHVTALAAKQRELDQWKMRAGEAQQLREAIRWALGCNGHFRYAKGDEGQYECPDETSSGHVRSSEKLLPQIARRTRLGEGTGSENLLLSGHRGR